MSCVEEQIECPLCMEPLEMDDINFFPCTCGYQICRFCWHRIRTDENGLCPACRKQYPEDPAEFKPLTEDELQRIKKERRQKDLQRKQKAAENRKHLANVRVVQRNLVFVVGLSQRLADPEVLKKHEYFGKFGKTHKVVINQSTSYAGSQGPSASAYVTYHRWEDALRAIQAVNNVHIDGRTLKASLGTTKYCSHFLKGSQCQKSDCMYLHELGEEAASFTKEEMQMGKHQEYEQKLIEQFINGQNTTNSHQISNKLPAGRKKSSSPINVPQNSEHSPPPTTDPSPAQHPPSNTKEIWPSLNSGQKTERLTNGNKANHASNANQNGTNGSPTGHSRAPGNHRQKSLSNSDGLPPGSLTERVADISDSDSSSHSPPLANPETSPPSSQKQVPSTAHLQPPLKVGTIGSSRRLLILENETDSLSLFSGNGFPANRNPNPPVPTQSPAVSTAPEISETIPVSSSTDWTAAFGFGSKLKESQDDDLGFDPWDESSKALAEIMEKENGFCHQPPMYPPSQMCQAPHSQPPNVPPGFSLNYLHQHQQRLQQNPHQQFIRPDMTHNSKMMGYMPPAPGPSAYHDGISDAGMPNGQPNAPQQTDPSLTVKGWQDGLRALLPNINISFGGPSSFSSQNSTQQKNLEPQANNHRLPFVQQFPFRGTGGWPQTHNPPPGFQTDRSSLQPSEPHTISEAPLQ